MPDSRYLDGDPSEPPPFLFQDLSPFVQRIHRELLTISALIDAGRYEEADVLATEEAVRAQMLLQQLEVAPLPPKDV